MFGLIWLIIKIIIAFYIAIYILSFISTALGFAKDVVIESGKELKQETVDGLKKGKKSLNKFWKEIEYIITGDKD